MGSDFIGAVTHLATRSSPLRVPHTCMALLKANLSSPVSVHGRCALLNAKHVISLMARKTDVQTAESLMTQARSLLDAFGDQARPRTSNLTLLRPQAAACGWRSPTKDHAAFVALGELDVRCAKVLTKRRNVQCTGEAYESISDIAKELAAANVRSLSSIYQFVRSAT